MDRRPCFAAARPSSPLLRLGGDIRGVTCGGDNVEKLAGRMQAALHVSTSSHGFPVAYAGCIFLHAQLIEDGGKDPISNALVVASGSDSWRIV